MVIPLIILDWVVNQHFTDNQHLLAGDWTGWRQCWDKIQLHCLLLQLMALSVEPALRAVLAHGTRGEWNVLVVLFMKIGRIDRLNCFRICTWSYRWPCTRSFLQIYRDTTRSVYFILADGSLLAILTFLFSSRPRLRQCESATRTFLSAACSMCCFVFPVSLLRPRCLQQSKFPSHMSR